MSAFPTDEEINRLAAKTKADRAAAEARAARDRAVGHAVRALTPIIPAFAGDAIGRAIIELADELRAYIEGPTS